jgi:hypothetical protein
MPSISTDSVLDAAASLHEKADSLPGSEKVAAAAHTAANVMESGAEYFRDRDIEEMVADLKDIARRHPGATLLTAAALGFLLARTFARH